MKECRPAARLPEAGAFSLVPSLDGPEPVPQHLQLVLPDGLHLLHREAEPVQQLQAALRTVEV